MEERTKRQAVDRAFEDAAVNCLKYDGAADVEGERQTNGHDRLRRQEVGARPCYCAFIMQTIAIRVKPAVRINRASMYLTR